MIRYQLMVVGRHANDPLLESASNYLDRLNHYASAELVRLKESTVSKEGEQILARLRPDDLLIALDEHGQRRSSRELAHTIEQWRSDGYRSIAFAIGGADGLCSSVKARAKAMLSLSSMTLPHRLALVVLLEQLYRAHTILKGEPYHRD